MLTLLQSPAFDIRWEPRQGALWLESPGRTLVLVGGVDARCGSARVRLTTTDFKSAREEPVRVEDAHGSGEAIVLNFNERQGLAFSVQARTYPARPFVLFRLKVTNKSNESLTVERFFLRSAPPGLKPMDMPDGFYRSGWQSWSPAGFVPADGLGYRPANWLRPFIGPFVKNAHIPWPSKPGRFWSNTVGAVISPREALVVGGASLADQFVQIYTDLRPGRLGLLVQSQADCVPLAPGEALSSEWFYFEWSPLPQPDPLAQYAYAVARQMELPRPRPAPLGWCSWYMYGDKVGESDMMENLASAALLSPELPLEVIQLDQGFEPIWGDWIERNARFPHSLDWLADRIGGSDFTPGLWLAPLTAHPRSQMVREHPDWLLRNERGRPVSAGLAAMFLARALDPTHPGVEAYLRELVQTAVQEWGYRYLKLDYLYAGALAGQRHNPRLTRAQAYRHALQIIRDAAGEETYLLGCGAPLGPSLGLVDAMRISADTAPHWQPNFRGVRRLLRKELAAPSMRNALQNVLTRAWTQGRWWTNDPDALMVRDTETELTEAEIIAQATLIGLNGGLVALSDALPRLAPERRRIAAALMPPLTEGMDTLELFQREMPEVVTVPMARAWGRWRLVGLFNWRDKPDERALPRDLPDMSFVQAYHIVDFWAKRYLLMEPGAPFPSFSLPPHGGVLLGIRPVEPRPHLVGTTFHISQGGEVTAWEVTPGALVLSLDIGRVAQGDVWLALPARPTAALFDDEPLSTEAIRAVAPGVWAVTFMLRRRGTLLVWYPT